MRANKRAITITDTDAGNQTYCRYFARAFRGSFADSCCDLNGDGKVTVKEAYDIAIAEH